ncbi:Sph1p KNAG_0J02780 [Huiozyma naganishii CBS 8797]|uniref:GIT Spa2 homology (SHD) domain-containing protein n=1 Tax=Huiozyma naganishii (strain ATCC MYA-139 / BCRC 22969 / CBS 8797 / KCTC 17520 / NBRC 10181 / NCYC 3082 / Yp74L-3) TaxID=1071383 RepID=J7S313_HUIN7|nr:hypothetical protein KNAG_0J02780 [Kazachstania naganishii CBS 8797]CCK72357.1 hypothetical protein KNAG_0J02780 [Kazachstania naganishii CBS 8797]
MLPDETFNRHRLSIKEFFANEGKEHMDNFSCKRASKARTKLSNLSSEQFLELSTDVNEELHRRRGDYGKKSMLSTRDTFFKKRNQAREKLAFLSKDKFADLLTDIMFEIENRSKNYQHDQNNSNNNNNNAKDVIQKVVVVPTKATIDWSSEDEDAEIGDDTFTPNFESNTTVERAQEQPSIALTEEMGYDGDDTRVGNENSVEIEQLMEENRFLKKQLAAQNVATSGKVPLIHLKMDQCRQYNYDGGRIPFDLVKRLHITIQEFFHNMQPAHGGSTGEKLFLYLSKMTKTVSDIVLLVDVPEFKGEVALLKSSLSNVITATRYFVLYEDFIPPIAVHAALNDLLFTLCDLIKVSGTRIDPEYQSSDISLRSVQSVTSDQEEKEQPSPVKPLKIAGKLRSSNSQSTASITSSSSNLKSIPSKSLLHDLMETNPVTTPTKTTAPHGANLQDPFTPNNNSTIPHSAKSIGALKMLTGQHRKPSITEHGFMNKLKHFGSTKKN